MITWISALSPHVQLILIIIVAILIILLLLLIAFIAVKSKIDLKVAGQEISIGDSHATNNCITCVNALRDCSSCITTLRNISHVHEQEHRKITSSCMEKKMIFVDQKVAEIQALIFNEFNNTTPIIPDNICVVHAAIIEPNIFLGRLELAMKLVNAELRRSFKQNGYHEKSPIDYKDYKTTQTSAIITIITTYLNTNYPHVNMLITHKQIISLIDNIKPNIQIIISDIYDKSIKIDDEIDIELNKLEREHDLKIQQFIPKPIIPNNK